MTGKAARNSCLSSGFIRSSAPLGAVAGLFLLLAACGGGTHYVSSGPGAPPPDLAAPPGFENARAFAPRLGAAPLPRPNRRQRVILPAYLAKDDPGNVERYPMASPNPVKSVADEPVSTFSVDVDRASYANVRRYLTEGSLPPADAVRVEEMVNYFDYDYPLPRDKSAPFSPTVAVYPSPWNKDTQILHIGIKGFDIPKAERPKANLVFLVDTSGSMQAPNRLPLFKRAFHMLVDRLHVDDTVAIVAYAGSARIALDPTAGSEKARILAAADGLNADGMTAGGEGLRLAYRLAQSHFDKRAVNRVLIASDGDFNAGIRDTKALTEFVARERSSGVYLTVLGFGEGNYNDALMQALAQAGNGVAAYIDSENEARKVFEDELSGTLFTIAKDVKVEVAFDPARVGQYRLIGYETRALTREEFRNDAADAGDIGSGHTVTALYEITPAARESGVAAPADFARLRIAYKLPGEERSRLMERSVTDADRFADFARLPTDIRFAAAVAGAGQLLRYDPSIKDFDFARAITIAEDALGDDEFGYRSEFIRLIGIAKAATTLTPLNIAGPLLPE